MGTRNPERDAIITLGWLADNGYVFQAVCRCGHKKPVQVIPLAARFGRQATSLHAARHMICTGCGRHFPELHWMKWDKLFPPPRSDSRWINGG
jgi:hypothetical protein